MRLSAVLTAVNENIKYWRFVPIFIEAWRKFFPDIQIVIVYIGLELPDKLLPYKSYITRFVPLIPDISTAYISQIIRLAFPAIIDVDDDDGILITDIDMIPMNSWFYKNALHGIPSDKIVSLRPRANEKEYYMCYMVATAPTWSRIFGIKTLDDVYDFLKKNYNSKYEERYAGEGWTTDQEVLARALDKLPQSDLVVLEDAKTGFNRFEEYLDDIKVLLMGIYDGRYADCHMAAAQNGWYLEDIIDLSKNL